MNTKNKILAATKNLLLISVGTVIIAFGTAVFTVQFDLVTGGIAGLAIILDKLIPISWLGIDLIVAVLTWTLFVFGLFTLGHVFILKTFVSALLYPPFFSLFLRFVSPDIFGGYFYLKESEYSQIAILIAAIIGGAMVGTGCALSFLGGGSTGGTDIIALSVCKFVPRIKTSKVIFAIDASIVIIGMFVIRDMTVSVLGIISAFVCAFFVEKIQTKQKNI